MNPVRQEAVMKMISGTHQGVISNDSMTSIEMNHILLYSRKKKKKKIKENKSTTQKLNGDLFFGARFGLSRSFCPVPLVNC